MIFKSCVRGSCYQDYLNKNKEKDLKMNILGKNFINNSYLVPISTYPNEKILGSNENGYWPIFKSDKFGFNSIAFRQLASASCNLPSSLKISPKLL